MLQLLSGLDLRAKYHPRIYIVAETDALSEVRARRFEEKVEAMEGKDVRFLDDSIGYLFFF